MLLPFCIDNTKFIIVLYQLYNIVYLYNNAFYLTVCVIYFISKAHFRRGESFKIILKMPELQKSLQTMYGTHPNGKEAVTGEVFIQVINDFLKCIELQEIPEPKIYCDVIMICIDYGEWVVSDSSTKTTSNLLVMREF